MKSARKLSYCRFRWIWRLVRFAFCHYRVIVFLLWAFSESIQGDEIAFLYALDADWRYVVSQSASNSSSFKVGDATVGVVRVGDHTIVAMKMGAGCVQTASNVMALFQSRRPDWVLSTGPVGALTDDLSSGTWVAAATILPYQAGSWKVSGFQSRAPIAVQGPAWILPSQLPDVWKDLNKVSVASGEAFMASQIERVHLRSTTKAQTIDMNLFGLNDVCRRMDVPLVAFRVISDLVNDQAELDFKDFVKNYDGAGGKLAYQLILGLPPNPNRPESYPALKKLMDPP